jgi:hypothetical protein
MIPSAFRSIALDNQMVVGTELSKTTVASVNK